MIDLDKPQAYQKFDSSNMLGYLHELPQQCRQAWQKAMSFSLPADYSNFSRVVILGMGGSAISGDLIGSLVCSEAGLPVFVWRDYELPSFVDARTLVIASSYSGETEETLSAFAQALKTSSKKLAITTGGRLRALAEENGVPVFELDYGAPPRAALGYSFVSLLGIFQKLGLVGDKSQAVAEMVELLEELSPGISEGSPLALNPAKQLATKLFGRIAVIYGAGILSEVAHRWKTQLNENSKAWAFYEVFPELDHNAVVGYEFPSEMASEVFVVLLWSPALHPRILARYELTREILARAGVGYELVEAMGKSPLSQMMSLVLFGDYVSYYLALLNQVDPLPVKAIDYLKGKLAEA